MHFVRAPNRRGRRFGQPDVPHLALTDECRERADTLFDWHLRVHPMQVQEVDHVGAQTSKTVVAGREDRVRRSVGVDSLPRLRWNDAALCRQDDVAAPGAEAASDERFVVSLAVNRGGIEECDAEVECPMDRTDRFFVIARAVRLRHAHTSEPDRGYERTTSS